MLIQLQYQRKMYAPVYDLFCKFITKSSLRYTSLFLSLSLYVKPLFISDFTYLFDIYLFEIFI